MQKKIIIFLTLTFVLSFLTGCGVNKQNYIELENKNEEQVLLINRLENNIENLIKQQTRQEESINTLNNKNIELNTKNNELALKNNELENKLNSLMEESELIGSQKPMLSETIEITKISKSDPNDFGSVDLFIGFKNLSDKSIISILFSVIPYDSDGNIVYSDFDNKSLTIVEDTGTYHKNEGIDGDYEAYWKNTWVSHKIDSVKITQIIINYSDNTALMFSKNDLN